MVKESAVNLLRGVSQEKKIGLVIKNDSPYVAAHIDAFSLNGGSFTVESDYRVLDGYERKFHSFSRAERMVFIIPKPTFSPEMFLDRFLEVIEEIELRENNVTIFGSGIV